MQTFAPTRNATLPRAPPIAGSLTGGQPRHGAPIMFRTARLLVHRRPKPSVRARSKDAILSGRMTAKALVYNQWAPILPFFCAPSQEIICPSFWGQLDRLGFPRNYNLQPVDVAADTICDVGQPCTYSDDTINALESRRDVKMKTRTQAALVPTFTKSKGQVDHALAQAPSQRRTRVYALRAGGLGLLHQAAGVGDQVGDFEGFYQAGHTFFLQKAAHFRFCDGGEREQQMFLHAGTIFYEPAMDFADAAGPLAFAVDDDGVE